jgi:cysteine desulfurase/selenocysteine lyase
MLRSSISAMSDFLVKYNELGPDSEASDNYVRGRLTNLRKEISELIKCRPEKVILT